MKVEYIVISPEEFQMLGVWFFASKAFLFIGRTPQEAIRQHNKFFHKKKELFGKCTCFIGTLFEEKNQKVILKEIVKRTKELVNEPKEQKE